MSDIQGFEFGDYAYIEQKRYGVVNEIYQHKVIGTLKSNSFVDVPVKTPAEETLHDEMEDVVACICCGVCETEVRKYRQSDVHHDSTADNENKS